MGCHYISNSKMKKLLIFIIATLVVVGCSYNHKNINKRIVTVTIEPLRYFTEQIAGDKFLVRTMVPNGSSPETYEPTAKQMIELSKSDLYIKVGNLGFERIWMKKLNESAPHLIMINSSDGITPATSSNETIDPHTWTSPANAKIIALNIYRSLCDLDQKDSLYFKERLTELNKHIDAINYIIRNNLKKQRCSNFLIYHPTLTYFARDYGIKQIPIEEEGKEPSASQLKTIIATAKAKHVKILLIQKEFSTRNTDVIIQSTGVKPVEINPLAYDWCKEMVKISMSLK
jgi:zinc transport system substrate-binding protein